jgi:hypothetical protein
MLNTYNPVLSGIMTAYGLADRIRQAALDEQRMQFEREREERMREEAVQLRQERQRTAQLQDLQTRLGLATSPELVDVGAEPTRTIDAAIMDPTLRRAYGAPSVSIGGVPTQGALEYGGKRYAVRSPEEVLNRQLREKAILSNAENVAAAERARKVFEATAVAVPAELAGRAGIPAGSLVSPTVIDDILRAVAAGEKQPTPPVQIPGRDIPYSPEVEAQRKRLQRPAASAAGGELTAYQRSQQARQERQDTEAQEKAKRAELRRLETEENQLQGNVLALRVAADTGKDAEGNKVNKPLARAQLATKENRLKQIRKRKVELGFTTAEEAGLTGAAPAPTTVAAAPKTWEDYKRAKTGGQ